MVKPSAVGVLVSKVVNKPASRDVTAVVVSLLEK
jgi:hypothetical protein